jgi:hypothetical protein
MLSAQELNYLLASRYFHSRMYFNHVQIPQLMRNLGIIYYYNIYENRKPVLMHNRMVCLNCGAVHRVVSSYFTAAVCESCAYDSTEPLTFNDFDLGAHKTNILKHIANYQVCAIMEAFNKHHPAGAYYD